MPVNTTGSYMLTLNVYMRTVSVTLTDWDVFQGTLQHIDIMEMYYQDGALGHNLSLQ